HLAPLASRSSLSPYPTLFRSPPRPLPPRLRTPRGPRRLGGTAVPDRVRRPGQERVRPDQRASTASAVPRRRRASGSHTVPRTARLPARRRLRPRPRPGARALRQDGPHTQRHGDRPQEAVPRHDHGPVRPLRRRGEAVRHRPRGRTRPQRPRSVTHTPAFADLDLHVYTVDP